MTTVTIEDHYGRYRLRWLFGVSTHSFRRTALTRMANAGVPLSVIQRISGHTFLATLQPYLEVSEGQIGQAIAAI